MKSEPQMHWDSIKVKNNNNNKNHKLPEPFGVLLLLNETLLLKEYLTILQPGKETLIIKEIVPSTVGHTCELSTRAEAGGSRWGQVLPGLHMEFKAILDYTARCRFKYKMK